MKKICFFSGDISRSGGTERVGTIIANKLSEKGYDVRIHSMWDSGKPFFFVDENIQVDYLLNRTREGKLYRTVIYPIIKLKKYIVENDIDIMIDIDTLLSYYTTRAIQRTKCKLISWEHFNYWAMDRLGEPKRYKAKKLIKKYASAMVVLTDEDRIMHNQQYELPENFVETINNPCLSNVKVDYKFENKTFVSVGRLTYQKGYEKLLEAWSMIENDIPDWKLIIVGTGELERSLKDKKNEMNLKNVFFPGHTDNVGDFYKEASAYVLSSVYEGFPMVILEAQSYGLPVISFDCKTGPKDLIENNKTGFLVKAGDSKELARKMLKFTKDEKSAVQMSNRVRQNIQKYNLETIILKWCKLIDSLLR